MLSSLKSHKYDIIGNNCCLLSAFRRFLWQFSLLWEFLLGDSSEETVVSFLDIDWQILSNNVDFYNFCQKTVQMKSPREYFFEFHFVEMFHLEFESWITSNKPTHYLLDCCSNIGLTTPLPISWYGNVWAGFSNMLPLLITWYTS